LSIAKQRAVGLIPAWSLAFLQLWQALIHFIKSFLNKNLEITDLGDLSYILGILVTGD